MKNKELKIEVPQGYEIDKEKSTFEKIVFKKVENLPKSWEEFGEIEGWFVNELSNVVYYSEGHSTDFRDRSIFPIKEEAEACVALAQLCQLREKYNDGWKPDWKDARERKYCIEIYNERLQRELYYITRKVLFFKNEELADKFLENFRDLIEIAKPLL